MDGARRKNMDAATFELRWPQPTKQKDIKIDGRKRSSPGWSRGKEMSYINIKKKTKIICI
jgi:hypothetical protein